MNVKRFQVTGVMNGVPSHTKSGMNSTGINVFSDRRDASKMAIGCLRV